MMLDQLDEQQQEIVLQNSSDIEKNVPKSLLINWKRLRFQMRLGSGSFGDCFQGLLDERSVAIKKMRTGLIDSAGVLSFKKEVVMLSTISHTNIVTFVGYCMDPFLLIVMDFVEGGTLKDYIASVGFDGSCELDIAMKILLGSARAFQYLHGMDPAPILHRDIKSENILLKKNYEPRVADLGEARVMAENRTMTTVGTRGYTAPEVLCGSYYGTAADVYSFAIVMSEVSQGCVCLRKHTHNKRG